MLSHYLQGFMHARWLFGISEPSTVAPENGWLEYYFPIGEAYFQVRTVSFREGTPKWMVFYGKPY